jgi:hypothetical protein
MSSKTTIKWDRDAINAMQTGPQKRLVTIGLQIEGDIKRSFTSGGTSRKAKKQDMALGTTFKRRGKEIARSAPGQPPAVDTGRLRASITTNWTDSGNDRSPIKSPAATSASDDGIGSPGGSKDEFKVVVGSNVVYARALELGNPRKYLLPRPYLTPIFEKYRSKIVSSLKGSATSKVVTD